MYSRRMPGGDFYAGLPLAEQLEKFVDHHHDRRVRHISQDEAQILYEAVARLKAGVGVAERRQEFDENWGQLTHVYETSVTARTGELVLHVSSIPSRQGVELPSAPDELRWQVLASTEATPRTAQIALNTLLRWLLTADTVNRAALISEWKDEYERRSPPADARLGDLGNELLNRALYQPTVPLEESPPIFDSLASVLAQEEASHWLALIVDDVGDPVAIIRTTASILLFKILWGPVAGVSDGLRERSRQWAAPSDQEAKSSDKGKGTPKKKPRSRKGRKKRK